MAAGTHDIGSADQIQRTQTGQVVLQKKLVPIPDNAPDRDRSILLLYKLAIHSGPEVVPVERRQSATELAPRVPLFASCVP